MNKRITGSALAALLIAGTTSFSAFAAMPEGTAVVGDKAFDLNYINMKATAEDKKAVQDAVVNGQEIYIKKFDGSWVKNFDGSAIEASILPQVTYKDENGNVKKYAAKDGDEVTTDGAVSEVKAVAVNKIKVTFDGAVDTSKVNFTVKRGTSVREFDSITWNEAKTEATIKMVSNLTKGDYTVEVAGLGETISKTIAVENRRVESVAIEGDTTPIVKYKDGTTDKAKVNVKDMIKVYDQYGNTYKMSEVEGNLTVTTSLAKLTDKYEYAVDVNADLLNHQFVLSVVYTDNANGIARTDSKTIKVGNETRIEEMTLGGLYTKDSKGKIVEGTINTGSDVSKFMVKVSVKDQYGNAYGAKALEDMIKAGTLRVVNPYFTVNTFETDEDGNIYAILAKALNVDKIQAIDSEFILISNYGKKAAMTISIEEAVALDNMEIEWPEIVAGGDAGELKFTAYDQNGNEMKAKDALSQLQPKLAANYGKITLTVDGEKLKYTVEKGITVDTPSVVSFLTPNNKFYQKTLTIKKDAKAEEISVKDLAKYATQNSVVKLGDKSVEVYDQYGRKMKEPKVEIVNAADGYKVVKESGVEVITIKSGDATVEHKINVVKKSELAAIKADGTKELYVPLADKNLDAGKVAKYAGKFNVYGETSNGSKVLLSGSEYSITPVEGVNVTTSTGIKLENNLGLEAGKSKEINFVVVPLVDGLTAAVHTVKFSTEKPVVKEVNPVDELEVIAGPVTNAQLLDLIKVKDQYGVSYKGTELSTYMNGALTSIVINGVTADNNGSINASIGKVESSKTFKVTYFFGSESKVIEVKVK